METKSKTDSLKSIFVGTYTQRGSEGIYELNFNDENGEIGLAGLVVKTENPSYLTISKDRSLVVAVNEMTEGTVSVFKQNGQAYEKVSGMATGGMHPCYIDFNEDETRLSIANYSSGNTSTMMIDMKGNLADLQVIDHLGDLGTNAERQEGPHGHFATFRGDDVISIDLGIDEVKRLSRIDESSQFEASSAFNVRPGDGPRHLEFHPKGELAFLITELTNYVVSLNVEEDGTFTEIDRQPTLPSDFKEHSQAADIHVSPDGNFVYASNRGHESIAIMKILEDGKLEFIGTESTRGKWPRNFVISPNGKWLIVANEHTDNIVVFKRDLSTGMLEYSGNELELAAPTCLKF